MNEEMEPRMTVGDAFKTLHKVNKEITVHGLNALEIENLKKLNADQWKKVTSSYKKWTDQIWFVKGSIWLCTVIAGILIFIFLDQLKYWGLGLCIIGAYFLIKRGSHQEGYLDGYHDGVEEGVNRALGIDEKLSDELYEIAKELKINEPIVRSIEKREIEQAISEYDTAIKTNPDDLAAYMERANVYFKFRRFDEAIKDCNEVIRRNSDDETILNLAYYTRASSYAGKDDFNQAIADYTVAIKISPKDALGYAARGRTYLSLENYDSAISDLVIAINLDPEQPDYYADRAIAYFYKKEFDKSWADVHEVEKSGGRIDPEFLTKLKNAGKF